MATTDGVQTSPVDGDPRPVINDVKLVSKDLLPGTLTVSRFATTRRQRTPRPRLEPGRPSDDSCLTAMPSHRLTSTFSDLPLQNVFIDVGDYQTLLRPSRKHGQSDDAGDDADTRQVSEHDAASYGDDTLRAIAVITEKFDSFRRRQHRVKSFLASRVSRSVSRDSSTTLSDEVTADTCRREASSRSTAAVAAISFRRRLAADHAITLSPPEDSGEPEVVRGGHVTSPEVERVRLFYSSLGSRVVVCNSLADVYVGSVSGTGVGAGAGRRRGLAAVQSDGVMGSDSVAGCCWVHLLTGVLVLVLNVGDSRHRRELRLVVADRSTALPQWQDRITSMSAFRQLTAPASPGSGAGAETLTMRVSGGLTKRVRFDVFSRCAACEFMTAYQSMTSDPGDELWHVSNDSAPSAQPRHHHRRTSRLSRVKVISTRDVSRPCEPRWITRVDAADVNFRSAFSEYLPVPTAAAAVSTTQTLTSDSTDFRPRLPTQ